MVCNRMQGKHVARGRRWQRVSGRGREREQRQRKGKGERGHTDKGERLAEGQIGQRVNVNFVVFVVCNEERKRNRRAGKGQVM